MKQIAIDVSEVFFSRPPSAKRRADLDGVLASDMFALADEDYLCYCVFARTMSFNARFKRIAFYHLAQAVEKYLKALYMAETGKLERELQTHGIVEVLGRCAEFEPALASPSLAAFCRRLEDFNQTARYPDDSGLGVGTRKLPPRVDEALQDIRTLSKASATKDGEVQLIERIIDRDGEWNPDPAAGFLSGVGVVLADAFRQALLAEPTGR